MLIKTAVYSEYDNTQEAVTAARNSAHQGSRSFPHNGYKAFKTLALANILIEAINYNTLVTTFININKKCKCNAERKKYVMRMVLILLKKV